MLKDAEEHPDRIGFAVVDVETTGLDPRRDRVVQVAITLVDGSGVVQDTWSSLVNPQRDPGPVHVHGLTATLLGSAPLYSEVAAQISQRLAGRIMVAHNVDFDWAFLRREHRRTGRVLPVQQRLCTMDLTRALDLRPKDLRLATLAAHWGVHQERAHDAVDDTRVLVEILRPSIELAASLHVPLPLVPCTGVAGLRHSIVRSPLRYKARRNYRRTRRRLRKALQRFTSQGYGTRG